MVGLSLFVKSSNPKRGEKATRKLRLQLGAKKFTSYHYHRAVGPHSLATRDAPASLSPPSFSLYQTEPSWNFLTSSLSIDLALLNVGTRKIHVVVLLVT